MPIAIFVICAAMLLGGGTHSRFLNEVLLQAVGVLALCWLIARSPAEIGRLGLAILSFIGFLVAFQLGFLGPFLVKPNFLPEGAGASLTPSLSMVAALSVLPALVVFAVAAHASVVERRVLSFVVLGFVVLNLGLGLLQIAQGSGSRLRFYEETNDSEAVGLFANRNHFAALLYCGLCLGSGFILTRFGRLRLADAAGKSRTLVEFVAGGVLITALLVGITASRSRTAIFLTMAAFFGAMVIVVLGLRRNESVGKNWLVLGIGIGAMFLAGQVGLASVAARFARDPLVDDRVAMVATSWDLLWKSMPFGLGLGSFETAYNAIEQQVDLGPGYAHRAHNDWLELLLETGVIGFGLMIVFLGWFTLASSRVWFGQRSDANELARPASLAIVLLLVHSILDYPLRTTAMQVVFALCCGLLFRPAAKQSVASGAADDARREIVPVAPQSSIVSTAPRRAWDGNVSWPKDWQ